MNTLFNKAIGLLDKEFLLNDVKSLVYTNYRTDVSQPISEIFIKVNKNIFSIRQTSNGQYRFDVDQLNDVSRTDINFIVISSKNLVTLTNRVIKYIVTNKEVIK